MTCRPAVSLAVAAALAAAVAGSAWAADAPVSREEFNKMLEELRAVRQEVKALKAERAAAAATQPSGGGDSGEVAALRAEVSALKKQRAADQQDNEDRAAEIEKTVKDVLANARSQSLGETKLLITGDAAVGFDAHRHSDSTFNAGVAPRLLWKINDRLMFDAALDIGIGSDANGNNATSVDLTIASLTYIINDYMVVGGGQFVAPFAAYHRNFDPPWINKLPDDPLVFSDGGLAPGSVLGMFVSGGIPVGPTKFNYAFYACNGPVLLTNDSTKAGSLDFQNATDRNNDKAFGGRVGFLPIPELEVGYSFLCGEAAPSGSPKAHSFTQAFDVNYIKQIEPVLGTLTLRGEWVFSHVNDTTVSGVDSTGTAFTTPATGNNANGGYVMVAYRPTLCSNKLLQNTEFIFRYDRMDIPTNLPPGVHEQRYTLGLDYWFNPRAVFKLAYECDDVAHGAGNRAIMAQFGLGF